MSFVLICAAAVMVWASVALYVRELNGKDGS